METTSSTFITEALANYKRNFERIVTYFYDYCAIWGKDPKKEAQETIQCINTEFGVDLYVQDLDWNFSCAHADVTFAIGECRVPACMLRPVLLHIANN